MAKILLYSIHDYECSGIRALGAFCRAHGHDARLCFLGSEDGMQKIAEIQPGLLHTLDDRASDVTCIVHSNPGHANFP